VGAKSVKPPSLGPGLLVARALLKRRRQAKLAEIDALMRKGSAAANARAVSLMEVRRMLLLLLLLLLLFLLLLLLLLLCSC